MNFIEKYSKGKKRSVIKFFIEVNKNIKKVNKK